MISIGDDENDVDEASFKHDERMVHTNKLSNGKEATTLSRWRVRETRDSCPT
jgi:hypothetical protein